MRTATGDIPNFLLLLQRQRDRTGHDELLENLARLRIPVEADLAVVVQTETEQFVISAGGFGGDQCEAMSGGHVGHLEERNSRVTQGLLKGYSFIFTTTVKLISSRQKIWTKGSLKALIENA